MTTGEAKVQSKILWLYWYIGVCPELLLEQFAICCLKIIQDTHQKNSIIKASPNEPILLMM